MYSTSWNTRTSSGAMRWLSGRRGGDVSKRGLGRFWCCRSDDETVSGPVGSTVARHTGSCRRGSEGPSGSARELVDGGGEVSSVLSGTGALVCWRSLALVPIFPVTAKIVGNAREGDCIGLPSDEHNVP